MVITTVVALPSTYVTITTTAEVRPVYSTPPADLITTTSTAKAFTNLYVRVLDSGRKFSSSLAGCAIAAGAVAILAYPINELNLSPYCKPPYPQRPTAMISIRTLVASVALIALSSTIVRAEETNLSIACKKVICPVANPEQAICGSDGNTYPSTCAFNQALCADPTLEKEKDGPCGPCLAALCVPDENDPLRFVTCASDGRVFKDECGFIDATCFDSFLTKVDCPSITSTTAIASTSTVIEEPNYKVTTKSTTTTAVAPDYTSAVTTTTTAVLPDYTVAATASADLATTTSKAKIFTNLYVSGADSGRKLISSVAACAVAAGALVILA
ncbi:hypothetical protein HDU67_010388 [Dinochytrium kinnereticum]|nr:hypothetical protein HDU67_010388 [Dinochytrium kinnereticum]